MLVTEGLSGLNMERVRKAASVSGSQLTHYFADKSALIRAVVRRQIGMVLTSTANPGSGTGHVRRLRALDRRQYALSPAHRTSRNSDLPRPGRTAREVRRGDPRDTGRGLLAMVELLEASIQRKKDRGVLATEADRTAGVGHRQRPPGRRHLAFTYREEWPLADAIRFAVNYLRMFAADPAERAARPPRRPRGRRATPSATPPNDDSRRNSPARDWRPGRDRRRRGQLMFERGVADPASRTYAAPPASAARRCRIIFATSAT